MNPHLSENDVFEGAGLPQERAGVLESRVTPFLGFTLITEERKGR